MGIEYNSFAVIGIKIELREFFDSLPKASERGCEHTIRDKSDKFCPACGKEIWLDLVPEVLDAAELLLGMIGKQAFLGEDIEGEVSVVYSCENWPALTSSFYAGLAIRDDNYHFKSRTYRTGTSTELIPVEEIRKQLEPFFERFGKKEIKLWSLLHCSY